MEATATKPRTVTFHAKYPDLTVGITPPREIKNFSGDIVHRSEPISAITATEEELKATNELGPLHHCSVFFDSHMAQVSEPVAARLRVHRYFNAHFWEQGNEPDALRPLVEQQLADLRAAERARDLDAALAVVASEEASHQRRAVLEAGQDVLRYLQTEAAGEPDSPEPSTDAGEPDSDVEDSERADG